MLSSLIQSTATPSSFTSASDIPVWHFKAGRESWIAISTVVLSLTLSHLVQRVKARRAIRLRQSRILRHPVTSSSSINIENGSEVTPPRRSAIIRAIRAQINTFLYLYIIPPWLYAPETSVDAIWTIVYCILMLFCAIYQCPISNTEYPYLYLANRFGVLSYAQTPIIFLLAVKNNPLSPLTGITYQKLNYLHRASARACIAFAWLHVILWFLPVLYAGHLLHWYIIWGTVALVSFTGLWATSVRSLRRRSFEFFLITHILFSAVFIVGAILHWPLQAYWIWPALAIWVLDRIIRFIRLAYINRIHLRPGGGAAKGCTVEIVSRDVMRVTIARPGLKWKAGQHFFFSAPSIGGSVHESHPFSIANLPNPDGELVFLIRAHNGFTRRLIDRTPSSPLIYLEGPYGHSHTLNHFHSILLISGGTGVTFALSHFLAIISDIRSGRGCTKRVKLVWHVRHAEDVWWITEILDDALSEPQGGLREKGVKVEVEVWVTRSKASSEPWEIQGTEASTPIWTRQPSRAESEDTIGGDERPENGKMRDGYGSMDPSPASSAGSRYTAIDSTVEMSDSTAEMSEVSEMTRLIPRLGRMASSTPMTRGIPTISSISAIPPSSLPRTLTSSTRPNSPIAGHRISLETQRITSLHPGRADLLEIMMDMADDTPMDEGGMMVVACGPVPLMHDTRRAVGVVNSWKRVRGGSEIVEFFEETVGH